MKKDVNIRQQIVRNYYEHLKKKCQGSYINSVNNWCDLNLDIDHLFPDKKNEKLTTSFEKIVTADLEKLLSIRDYIDSNKVKMTNALKRYLLKTVYQCNIDRLAFVRDLGVTVCPYCNRNFINSSSRKTSCQLDHFINKSDYPILSVSFYNLVPVCGSCNHKKGSKDFSYSPYDNTIEIDDMLTFSYDIKGVEYLSDLSKLQILIDLGLNKILDKNIKILELEELYQIHKDVVQELLIKKEIYIEEYQEQLFREFRGVFASKQELEQLIIGAYVESENYGKRPLSKMVSDIGKELGIVKGNIKI
ncbi:HNH endonuclease [Paenibacillus polymyxa]|uniref:HNH endonuclease n=1 Tax=Paenibacillus polymyxa TaxID=1406 RepID=UPI000A7E0AF6|nr:HNH endonuclease [Paenibacillus polymyxa]